MQVETPLNETPLGSFRRSPLPLSPARVLVSFMSITVRNLDDTQQHCQIKVGGAVTVWLQTENITNNHSKRNASHRCGRQHIKNTRITMTTSNIHGIDMHTKHNATREATHDQRQDGYHISAQRRASRASESKQHAWGGSFWTCDLLRSVLESLQSRNLRVRSSNPRVIAYPDFDMPYQSPKPPGVGPIFPVELLKADRDTSPRIPVGPPACRCAAATSSSRRNDDIPYRIGLAVGGVAAIKAPFRGMFLSSFASNF